MTRKLILRKKLFFIEGSNIPFSGSHEAYWDNGLLRESGDIKEGLKDGLWRSYFENGILFEVGFYKEGRANGHWKIYYPDGQLSADLHYRDDKLDGYCEYFHQDGSTEEVVLYSLDEPLKTLWMQQTDRCH